ncbi:hypothetical protein [Enterococcus nangangensis]|uniref:hypothetical protein n=1 Tax=Enterococcus nangangensis TaxID=2559926 RepID=UPI0010F5F2C6|nr:hypothetical protein [Enterococcus nangangensis]
MDKILSKPIKLRKDGDSYILPVPKEVSALLRISADDGEIYIQYVLSDDDVILKKVDEASDEEVFALARESMKQYEKLYKSLVDK